jgi:hypothetical protein
VEDFVLPDIEARTDDAAAFRCIRPRPDSKIQPQMTFKRLHSNLVKILNSHRGSQDPCQQHAVSGNNSQTTEHQTTATSLSTKTTPSQMTFRNLAKDPSPDLVPIPPYHQ